MAEKPRGREACNYHEWAIYLSPAFAVAEEGQLEEERIFLAGRASERVYKRAGLRVSSCCITQPRPALPTELSPTGYTEEETCSEDSVARKSDRRKLRGYVN